MSTRDDRRHERYRNLARRLHGREGQEAGEVKRGMMLVRYRVFTIWLNILWDIEMLMAGRKV